MTIFPSFTYWKSPYRTYGWCGCSENDNFPFLYVLKISLRRGVVQKKPIHPNLFSLLHGLSYFPTLIWHSKVKTIWHFGRIFSKNWGGIVGSWQPATWMIDIDLQVQRELCLKLCGYCFMKEHSHPNAPVFLLDFLLSIFTIQCIKYN